MMRDRQSAGYPEPVENLRASAARHHVKADDVEQRNAVERPPISQVGAIPPLRHESSAVAPPRLVDPAAPTEHVKPVPKPSPEGTPEFWTHVIR
jgi:hypothetical protein